uniref:Plant thionin family protein n=1 Tax=Brassica campestris TaxID=3711 RepID=M4D768_BRACM
MEIQKKSSVFMIIVMITIAFSAHISHSVNVEEMCIKHCIPNQCMKVMKNPDLTVCKEACQKFCNNSEQPTVQMINNSKQPKVQVIVHPRGDGGLLTSIICGIMKSSYCP